MCGICGIYDREAVAPDARVDLVRRMCDAIIHRGPDDEGLFASGHLTMGMRRLSIIDLDSGSQPIFNEDGTIAVVFNGEIYNFKDLRIALEAQGHRFATSSDTEVIVHLYEEYGEEFPTHLNGMFAIALWDAAKEQLLLVRDRLGVKPLYYSTVNGSVTFGSELKTVLLNESISPEVDAQAVYDYFVLGYIPQPRSIYRDIRKLPPGSLLQVRDGAVRLRRYWSYPQHPAIATDYDAAKHALRDLLTDATRLRMISDVPLGAFLSGGLDSSITVALMAQLSAQPIETFFIDFEEQGYSEREYARAVAARYGTKHHEFVVKPEAVRILDEIVRFFDEPFGDSSAIPTYYLSQMTRRHVTVALAGDGGDESFGGYRRYQTALSRRDPGRWRPVLQRVGSGLHRLLPRTAPGRRFFRSIGSSNFEAFAVGTQELETRDVLSAELLNRIECGVLEDLGESPRSNGRGHRNGDPLTPYAAFDVNWYLPDDILAKVDRMSMAHSLEVRAPFLDYRVIESAARMPVHWKIGDGETKRILRDVFRADLPTNVLEPRKRGFSIPLDEWFRNELKPELTAALHDAQLEQSGLFRMDQWRGLAAEHWSGRRSRKSQLWRFLVFARWWHLHSRAALV